MEEHYKVRRSQTGQVTVPHKTESHQVWWLKKMSRTPPTLVFSRVTLHRDHSESSSRQYPGFAHHLCDEFLALQTAYLTALWISLFGCLQGNTGSLTFLQEVTCLFLLLDLLFQSPYPLSVGGDIGYPVTHEKHHDHLEVSLPQLYFVLILHWSHNCTSSCPVTTLSPDPDCDRASAQKGG